MENNTTQVEKQEDLKHILSILNKEDADNVLTLKEELADNWNKKQIFRTETEMRISVLNDAVHPTPGSKYWQSVREMSAHFDALMNLSFDIRRTEVERLRLEEKMEIAKASNNKLDIMESQIELDQNVYNMACMQQVAHDRVREIQTWSKIKAELNDGSFDDKEVNTHQVEALRLALQNRASSLNEYSPPAEIINALGPLQTAERLTKDGKLLNFQESKLLLEQGQ